MPKGARSRSSLWVLLVVASVLLQSCLPQGYQAALPSPTAGESEIQPISSTLVEGTPIPVRPQYGPAELVDYMAQSGDTLPALAARFNTTAAEIRAANPIIPVDVTTLPPGMPMKIPIYYLPLWGTAFKILPDRFFPNGPAQVDFDTAAFVAQYPGWLANYTGLMDGYYYSGPKIVDQVAQDYSVSPRLLLAMLEYHSGALSQPELLSEFEIYPLGVIERGRAGLYQQLIVTANMLNNGYYRWRSGSLTSFELSDGRIERPDPWQNAATVALQHYYSRRLAPVDYTQAISPNGLAATYHALFGDPWSVEAALPPHIAGSLTQPEFRLPFEPGAAWAYTGGPHTGWGSGEPLAAIDFAPPAVVGGCTPTDEWATAVAAGTIARSQTALVVLDLDGDGDERTGWSVLYLHLATEGRIQAGQVVVAGQRLGHPSCEGGRSTGTHVHIARKYNGEWVLADGPLAFNLEGWVAYSGRQAYEGTLVRFSQTVTACTCSDRKSHIASEAAPLLSQPLNEVPASSSQP